MIVSIDGVRCIYKLIILVFLVSRIGLLAIYPNKSSSFVAYYYDRSFCSFPRSRSIASMKFSKKLPIIVCSTVRLMVLCCFLVSF